MKAPKRCVDCNTRVGALTWHAGGWRCNTCIRLKLSRLTHTKKGGPHGA